MAFQSGIIVLIYRQRAKRHSLIKLHIVPDDSGLTDYHTGSMVYEEALSDLCTGVYIDARA